MSSKIELEYKKEKLKNKLLEKINSDKKAFLKYLKLEFDVDLLNEPWPDLLKTETKNDIYSSSNDSTYKKRNLDIFNNEYGFP